MNVSVDNWLKEAKASEYADKVGMWLLHNGVVRSTSRDAVRGNAQDKPQQTCALCKIWEMEDSVPPSTVKGMNFSYDEKLLEKIIAVGKKLPGVYYLRAELSEGQLNAGEDIMYILIGADIRENAITALETVLSAIKSKCVNELEIIK